MRWHGWLLLSARFCSWTLFDGCGASPSVKTVISSTITQLSFQPSNESSSVDIWKSRYIMEFQCRHWDLVFTRSRRMKPPRQILKPYELATVLSIPQQLTETSAR